MSMNPLSFLVSDAWAEAAPAQQQGDPMGLLLMMVVFFVLMYFLMIRPQTKRAKEHKKMVEALAKGDEVVTGGGVAGQITGVGESFVEVEIAKGVVVKVQKHAVMAVLPKGTLQAG